MTRGPAPFTLHLLGSPRVEGPEGAADLPLGKPLALLCYVALEPSGVRRSDLARILWPSSSESRAKASIRQALWLIRKQTDADIVREDDGELTLDPDVVETDLAALGRDLAQGRLVEALERWDGGPLRGFSVPDARPWLTWADQVRSRWESQMGQALEDRAAALEGEDRAAWLRRALEVRPYRVEAWLALVQTLVDIRDSEGADAAMIHLRQVADEDDLELVVEAERRIRLLRRTAYGDPAERLVPEFVGRSEEFSALMRAWRSAVSGRSRVVGIVGEAGIGKTALAGEAVRHAEVDEGQTVEVRAVRTEVSLELGVVGSAIADLLHRPGAAGTSPGSTQVLRALVPSDGDHALPVPRLTTLADAVADLLDAVSHEAPVLLLVDDAHWIDEASALVLLRAVRQLRASRVMMIWTCRPGDHGAPNRGVIALRAAADEGHAELLELDPLTEGEVREMVALLLADSDPEALSSLADRVHLASGGSPYHIVEILQGLRDRGMLGLDDQSRWMLAEDVGTDDLELPASLPDALARRIDDLSDEARRVGAELSELDGPQTPEALGAAIDLARSDSDRAVRTLLDRGLVRWTRDDRLELAHDTLADAFRLRAQRGGPTTAPPPRRRWLVLALSGAAAAAAVMLALWPRPDAPPPFGG
ncbi:MAG: AAA family ATPase, partial [Longimicrobiales bacterium]